MNTSCKTILLDKIFSQWAGFSGLDNVLNLRNFCTVAYKNKNVLGYKNALNSMNVIF